MKKLFLGSAALVALMVGPAIAGDLPVGQPIYAVRPPIVAAAFNWSGFYLGGNVGFGWARASADVTFPGVRLVGPAENLSGAVAGGQVGANWQISYLVIGAEADFQASGQSITATPVTVGGITVLRTESIPSFGTVRGRVGFAANRALIYVTGGWAYGYRKSDVTVTGIANTGTATNSNSRSGYSAGAGVEFAATNNWTVKAEYLYLDTGTISNAPFVLAPTFVINTRLQDNIVRVGVNYLFNAGPAGIGY